MGKYILKWIRPYFIGLLALLLLGACGTMVTGKVSSHQGTLVKKSWSKTTESYCAQGSDFFMLITKDDSWIIDPGIIDNQTLELLKGKFVVVRGERKHRNVVAPENNISQRPETGSEGNTFECWVFELKSIKENLSKDE